MSVDLVRFGLITVQDPLVDTIALAGESDFGSGENTATTVAQLLLDGDVATGFRTGDREVTVTVQIRQATRSAATAVANQLIRTVNANAWQLTWTPPSGLAVTLMCKRAQVRQRWDLVLTDQGWTDLLITFQADPFWTNPVGTSRTGVLGSGTANGVQLDACDSLTVPGTVNGTAASGPMSSTTIALNTLQKAEGTGALSGTRTATASPSNLSVLPFVSLTRTLTATSNWSSYDAFTVQVAGVSSYNAGTLNIGRRILALIDTSNRRVSWTFTEPAGVGAFVRLTGNKATPTSADPGFDYSAIKAWDVYLETGVPFAYDATPGANNASTIRVLVDDLRGVASTQSTGSRVLRFAGVNGTARTPVSSIDITSATPLKQLLLARYAGQPPSFTPLVHNGTGVADAAASDGAATDVAAAGLLVITLTPQQVKPGAFQVWVRSRLTVAGPGQIAAQAYATVDNTAGGTARAQSELIYGPATSGATFGLTCLGELVLPVLPAPPAAVAARFFLVLQPITVGARIDEVYLVPSDADVTFLDGMSDLYVGIGAARDDQGLLQVQAYAGPDKASAVGCADRKRSEGLIYFDPGSTNEMLIVADPRTSPPVLASCTALYAECWHGERDL